MYRHSTCDCDTPLAVAGQLDGLEVYVSNLSMHRMEDAGHRPMQERPEVVNRVMRRFITR